VVGAEEAEFFGGPEGEADGILSGVFGEGFSDGEDADCTGAAGRD
jgi:hypothetical protein